NLRGNQIQEIKSFSALTGLNGLQNLILSNNSLTTFDHRILKGLENLEILLLQHNQLGCLNNFTFSHVPSLKIVMLNNNKLRCIAKGIFEKLNLESLSISSNPLKCDCHLSWLPDWLRENVDQVISGPSPPTCVEPEDLAGTPLASLARYHFTCNKPGEECGTSSKLTRPTEERTTRWPCTATTERSKCPDRCTCESDGVYCSDLGLTEIPENIPENTTKLYLERNQISEIHPERLEHLTKLHTLVLSYNEIRELQENAFSTLKSLKTLVLSHNNLQCIHQNAFKGLGGLRVLILQANNISSVPYGTFKELGQLNNIALGQNPFHCDCNGKWLNSFFRQQFLDNGVALCHSPANMQYKSLYHSKPGDFVCPWKRRYRRRANLSSVNTTQFGEDLTSALLVDDHGIDDLEIAEDAWSDTLELRRDGPFSAEERESLQIAAKCSPCMINPCAHNGQCIPMGQLNYRCQCKSPYHGTQCNLQEHVCAINPCQNGGTCETTPYSIAFRCVCPKDFRGPTCAERINSCSHNYCLNGGTCEQLGSDFRCNCPPEFHGKTCQRAVIYCEDVNPCLNGATCTQLPGNKYRCECERGWSGKNCHINQDDCLYNRCENGATCVDGINEYICKCRPGYAGVYCERPTWNPENHVTRMDRRVSAARRNQGVGSSQVRHSPIKIRSLSIPHLETPCAYHQCQNMATCVDSQTDGYQCRCQPGFSGQYCENLFSISLPSPHSYIAIVPPSRGALVPRGSLGLKMATHTSSGVVMYYAETVQTEHGEVPAHYLMVDLTDGYLRAMLSINRSAVHQQRSTKRINDGKFHKFELHVEGENLTLLVDDQWQIERPTFMMSNSVIDTAAHYLALNNPLYFGGAPADRLETAGRILHEKRILGITGCIRDIQINDRMTNIARLFGAPVDRMTGSGDRQSERPSPEAKHHGTAIGILPGCDKHQPDEETADEAGDQEPRQSDKEIPAWTVPMSKKPTGITAVQTGTCLNGACQNGGQCITLPGGTFKCECPQGYAGAHCEIAQTCRQETQKSYIRDPHTNCISTRKLTVRNCVGICPFNQTDAPAEFPQGLVLRKRRWENRSQQSIESVVGQNSATSCCQQSTLKYRRVRFRCLHGPNYDRTVKLIRGCTCQQCFA
ncbi:protein slit, partial [Clonorchis sinensis]